MNSFKSALSSRRGPSASLTLVPKLALFLLCGASLTACHTIKDAHWATEEDTVDRWERAMPKLPMAVRGQGVHVTNEELVQSLRQKFPASVTDLDDGALMAPHLVLDAGSTAEPAGNAYCRDARPAVTEPTPGQPLTVTLTLCDGTRLVGWSQQRIEANADAAERFPRVVGQLQDLLLIGIEQSPAQYVNMQG